VAKEGLFPPESFILGAPKNEFKLPKSYVFSNKIMLHQIKFFKILLLKLRLNYSMIGKHNLGVALNRKGRN
jgi:hypothetical protein